MALSKNYEELDSFVIHTCVEGRYGLIFGEQKSVKIEKGESVLIPAVLSHITMVPDGHTKILETYMELDETVKTEKI
jgi:mannose-6-phosphate isomerase